MRKNYYDKDIKLRKEKLGNFLGFRLTLQEKVTANNSIVNVLCFHYLATYY